MNTTTHKNVRVSVIIAVYNGVPFLKKAIDSALAQSHLPYEIIVIDDGSTDQTQDIIKSFGDKIISRRFANAGVATAMNRGLELATGDYAAFLDHDDVWFKDKLKKQVEAVSINPEAGFVCCNYAVRPPGMGGRLLKHFSKLQYMKRHDAKEPFIKDPLQWLLLGNFVGTSSAVFISRDVYRKVGLFNKNYKITGDFDYWLRCAAVTSFVMVQDVLFYKRTHTTNISSAWSRMRLEHREVLRDFFKTHKTRLAETRLLDRYGWGLADVNYKLGHYFFEEKKTREAFSFYWQALTAWRSFSNLLDFLWVIFKKTIRLCSLNALSRKNIEGRC